MRQARCGSRDLKPGLFLCRWKKCQLPKIRFLRGKQEGQADIVVGMFYLLIIFAVIMFGFRITQYMITSAMTEDALAASNLASAVIDLEEYGKSHTISIKDPESAFLLYKEALCHNLKLDEYLNTTNGEILASKVTIEEYRIYNVLGEEVFIFVLDETGVVKESFVGRKGEVYTPDGVLVETTTIYSHITFGVRGLMGQIIYAQKEKSIDIVRCENEEGRE